MKVEIVHKVKGKKEPETIEFNGANADSQGLVYIYNNQPIEVIAVRFIVD